MTWRISPNVAWTYDEDGVAVATVPDTQVYRLDSSECVRAGAGRVDTAAAADDDGDV